MGQDNLLFLHSHEHPADTGMAYGLLSADEMDIGAVLGWNTGMAAPNAQSVVMVGIGTMNANTATIMTPMDNQLAFKKLDEARKILEMRERLDWLMEQMKNIMHEAGKIRTFLSLCANEVYGISTDIKLINYEHGQDHVSDTGNPAGILQHNMFWKLNSYDYERRSIDTEGSEICLHFQHACTQTARAGGRDRLLKRSE